MPQPIIRHDAERPPGLHSPDQQAFRVYLRDVEFSKNAMQTIGLAVKHIAAQCEVFEQDIARDLFGDMYWLRPSNTLLLIFHVEEMEADMFVEIPMDHWNIRESGQTTQ